MSGPSLTDIGRTLTAESEGTVLAGYAQPRASLTALVGVHDGMLKVALMAPPVDGKANAMLLKFLSRLLSVPRSTLALVKGVTGRRKRVFVPGLTPEEVACRLSLS